jgi:hypothetical protein
MRSLIPCVLFFVTAAFAQNNTGTLTGSVSDTAKTPIAGASIEARNTETGAVQKASSGLTG